MGFACDLLTNFLLNPISKNSISVKILWAPIIDSVYVKSWGRRKSWMVPSQLLIGIFMLYLALHVDEWLGDGESQRPQILLLAIMFFILFFLTATQDVAVDGWALTMLKQRNVAYAATCNQVGQTIGFSISFAVLLVFESKDFCNEFIFNEPHDEGLITFSGFLRFCGVAFIVITILIAFLKREDPGVQEKLEDHPDYGAKKAYPVLWRILKMKPVLKLSLFIVSGKICIVACDSIAVLKLIDYGIPRDKIAVVSFVKMPLMILIPLLFSKHTTGKFPMNIYMRCFPFRMLMIVAMTGFVYLTPMMIADGIPSSFYLTFMLITILYEVSLENSFES